VVRLREQIELIDDILKIGAAHYLLRYGVNAGLDVCADNGADVFFGDPLGPDENQGIGFIGFGQRKYQYDTDNHRQTEGDNNQPAALKSQLDVIIKSKSLFSCLHVFSPFYFPDRMIIFVFLDRIYRINWIFFFGRSPEESAQTPIASGEGEHTHRLLDN
jgi:hypothetical protein